MNQIIEIISTGGTIDSYFDKRKDIIRPLTESVLPHYFLDIVRTKPECIFYELCMKDSRDFDLEKDSNSLMEHIRSSVASYFIVTIGTFAMPDVALQVISSYDWKSLGKKIIFTGAMCPMSGFLKSDGGFNLGYAFSQLYVFNQDPVLVSMNAQATRAGNVAKDLRTGSFRPTNIRDLIEDNLNNPIHFINTGGSIDSSFNALDGVTIHKKSQVNEYLRSLQLHKKLSFTQLPQMKHSYELDDKDFAKIDQSIKTSSHKNIIITAGTYSIEKLASYLEKSDSIGDKTVVITGSRFTLVHDDLTDAPFNLGYSIGAVAALPKGVYIAFCGTIIAPQDFIKTLYTPDEIKTIDSQVNPKI